MIITRTPFRITLGGGGSDLPAYYSRYGGLAFSAGIDKYMFINVNRPIIDDLVRVKYTKTEIVTHREDLEHTIAREAMRMMNIEKSLEIISIADVPSGTGLGSSSCYAVGLLNALHTLKREHVALEELAEEACRLEIDRLKKPIGKQDQYMAALGGLTVMEFGRDGTVKTREADVSQDLADELNRNLLVFYTATQREADHILEEQSSGVARQKRVVVESMHQLKEIGHKVLDAVESGNLSEVGLLFDEHWRLKRKISRKISSTRFDEIYERAKEAGALGGKITGAGGGGFFVFYVEKGHGAFREKMKRLSLKEMRYRFDHEGTKVLVNL